MDKQVFEETFVEIKAGAVQLFREQFRKAGDEVLQDITTFVEESKTKLEKWVGQLAAGEIDESIFRQFVTSQQSLLKMKVLTNKGLTMVKIDRFQNGLKNLIIDTILNKFLT